MAHPGAYRGTKRQKELKRLQKQQEKREKRLQKKTGGGEAEPEFSEWAPLDAPAGAAAEPGPEEPSQEQPSPEESMDKPAGEP